MLSKTRQITASLSGASKGHEVEHQIFNVTCLVLLSFGLQGGILNYFLGLHYMTIVLSVVGCIISILIYWRSIKSGKLQNPLLVTFVIATYLVLMPLHFYNGGSYGTVFFLLIMVINMFILIGKTSRIFIIYLTMTVAIILLIVLEMLFPQLVVPYSDSNQRYGDFITVILYSITFTSYIFWMYKNNHQKARLKIEAQNKALENSQQEIQHKNEKIEALLLEMHHRIKNNLQVVSSLIALQINRPESIDPKKALIESKNRLDVMSLLHQQLQINELETSVVLRDFITSVCNALIAVFQLKKETIVITYNQDNESLDFDKSNYIGLILNELITNSIKYAKPIEEELKININFNFSEKEFMILTYSDNGSGKINLDEIRQDSLGLKIIQTLVKQLNAELKIETEDMNLFTLKIPL